MSTSAQSWWLLPQRVNRLWFIHVFGFMATFFVLAKLGLAVASINVASTIWLPMGLSIAAIYLGGARYAWLIFVSDLMVELSTILPVSQAPIAAALAECLSISTGNMLEPLLAGLLWRKVAPAFVFSTVRAVCWFFLAIAPLAAVFGAVIGSLAVHGFHGEPFWVVFVHWWAGDLLGTVLIAPLLVLAVQGGSWQRSELRAAAVFIALTVLLSALSFWPGARQSHLVLPLFLPLIVMAIWRLPDLGVAILLAVIGLSAAIVPALDHSDIASAARMQQLLMFKQLLLLGACACYIALAFIRERKRLVRELSRYNEELETQIDERTQALSQTNERLQQVLDVLPHFVWAKNAQGEFVLVNRVMAQAYGLTAEQMQGCRHASLHGDSLLLNRLQTLEQQVIRSGCAAPPTEFVVEREGKGTTIYEVRTVPMFDSKAQTWLSLSVGVDVTAQKNVLQHAEHLALHDSLTGLANRRLFFQQIQDELKRIRRQKNQAALLYMDLDGFKPINDSYGHEQGDKVLQQIAQRLRQAVREQDVVARLGGDEFGVLLTQLHDQSEAFALAEKLVALVAEPVQVAGLSLSLTVSIGVVLLPDDGERPDPLLSNADAAMYRAKQAGKNRYMRFTRAMHKVDASIQAFDERLRAALKSGAIQVYWQPIYWLPEGRVLGVEALLRWRQDELHVHQAEAFIDHAEQGTAICELGELVWRQVELLTATLTTDVFVNVTAKQLRDPDLLRRLQSWPQTQRERVVIDIAERFLTQFNEAQLQLLRELSALGLRLCIDDCSIAALMWMRWRHLPLWAIKIGRATVQGFNQIRAPGLNAAVGDSSLTSMLTMAATMKVVVLAVGIETETAIERLVRAGIQGGQGWALAPEQEQTPTEAELSKGRPLSGAH